MKNSLRNLFLLLLTLLLPVAAAFAQPGDQPEMADALRQSGKIYVVVGVITMVLLGLLFYLVTLDRKITRLEREIE